MPAIQYHWNQIFSLLKPSKDIGICLILFVFIGTPIFSQITSYDQLSRPFLCGHDDLRHSNTELYKSQMRDLESAYESYITNEQHLFPGRTSSVVPVVFHIVHDGGVENISDASILQSVDLLNNAFDNAGYYDQGTGVTTTINFCLARQDPGGMASMGITRTTSSLTNVDLGTQDIALKNLIRWDPTQVINIWVVREICDGSNCGVAGYAYFPASHGGQEDGIVVEAEFLESGPENLSVLVHEMGHYFGLYHTFQGGCQNNNCLVDGDRVCDTPPDGTTTPLPCLTPPNSCSTDEDDTSTNNPFRSIGLGGLGDQVDMHINYMDYSDLSCYSAFTLGQSDRMEFFLLSTRSSLLASTLCFDPCPTPLSANIIESDMTINVGDALTLNGQELNASSVEWTVDGVVESNSDQLNYSFNSDGVFEIIFYAQSLDPQCRTERDTIYITVICPVMANFSPMPPQCIALDSTITFTNISINGTTHEWIYDGSTSSGSTITIMFSTLGRQELQLVSTNGSCSDTVSHVIQVGCIEICDNGYDDDGDLLVDYYDPDCCGTNASFEFLCDSACHDETTFPYNVGLKWRSSVATNGFNGPVVGDIDADGIAELVGVTRDSSIGIFDGRTGILERSFRAVENIDLYVAIADLDVDGFGEILVISRRGFLHCYEHDGTLKFISSERVTYTPLPTSFASYNMYTSVADFNQDGLPEIYVGNRIFNGQTGDLICSNQFGSKGVGQLDIFDSWQKWLTVAADILPDDYCSNCKGLELVAGNQVYSVDISTNQLEVEVMTPSHFDGFTAVVDFDKDGDQDVVVLEVEMDLVQFKTLCSLYVWDGQTNIVLGEHIFEDMDGSLSPQLGGMTVGNFDVDEDIEIVYKFSDHLIMIDHDFSMVWKNELTDGSATSPLAFDFDGDGILEVAYRDDADFDIFQGATGVSLFNYSVSSATVCEHFAIADIDGDQSAEIIVDGSGGYRCIGITSGPKWANTRPVFNQPQYFNVNINDDLSVPFQQQQHHLVGDRKILNNFLVNVSIPTPLVDGAVNILNVGCKQDSILLEIEICNEGNQVLSDELKFTIYCSSPEFVGAPALTTIQMNEEVERDSCRTRIVAIPATCTDEIFVVLNDDQSLPPPFTPVIDFPVTDIIECRYSNNMVSVLPDQGQYILDLGPDTIVCVGSSITLSASSNFAQYTWDDGSSDTVRTVSNPGIYWVEVVDSCGGTLRDSIEVFSVNSPQLDLGNDTVICAHGIVNLNAGGGFTSYRWHDGNTDSIYTVWASGEYSVTITDACGQQRVDAINVTFSPVQSITIGPDTTICAGDSIELSLPGGSIYQWGPQPNINCETCQTASVFPTSTTEFVGILTDASGCVTADTVMVSVDSSLVIVDTFMICAGDSIFLEGTWINMAGDYQFTKSSAGSCDSLLLYHVESNSSTEYFDTLLLCLEDTVMIEGIVVTAPGEYTYTTSSASGCDSVFNIAAQLAPTPSTVDSIILCTGDSIFLDSRWIYETQIVNVLLSTSLGCDSFISTNIIFQGNSVQAFGDTTIEAGGEAIIFINVDTSVITTVQWQPTENLSCPSCPSTLASPTLTTTYIVYVTDTNGCAATDSVFVEILTIGGHYIPTAFSPNDDGVNDRFLVYGPSSSLATYSIKIFNRWGGVVFERVDVPVNDEISGWDGYQNEKELNPGVFVYEIILQDGQLTKRYNGDLLLVR